MKRKYHLNHKAKPDSIWDETGWYDTKITNGNGSLCTIEMYKDGCHTGFLSDWDGYGVAVKDGFEMTFFKGKSSIEYETIVHPSECPDDIPEEATHILWFNK